MKENVKLTVYLLMLVFGLWACNNDNEELPPPDVSGIKMDVKVLRFDRAMMAIDTQNIGQGIAGLDRDFGSFSGIFLKHVIPLRRGDFSPEEQKDVMRAFLTYPLVQEVNERVKAQFSAADISAQEARLEQALRYYHYYLPGAPAPDTLVTYLAQFELAAFLYGEGQLAVGLDFHLGPDYDYLSVDPREPIFSEYLSRTYTPKHMTEKLMRVLIEDYIPRPRSGRLVDYLLYEGKKLYLLDKVLPETPNHLLHEVTAEQMGWLERNEVAIYAQLQKENQFYSTDQTLIKKLTQPAPYSQGMPRESPGQAVNYLGKQIIASYVRANPKVTMEELINIEDGQEILAGARYKPR
ncbi:MAG: hypothetical protein AAF597_03870 [Bacteroidota bacterium]